jgi:hypothetical protein
MKKISVLLILALLLITVQTPAQAGFIANQKARIEQNRIYKSTIQDIKNIIEKQDEYANKHDYDGIYKLYSDDFVNSDGFDKSAYFKLIKETWETYPDITYKTEIKNIEFTDNYATVFVKEIAVAAPKEKFGDYETVGELYSVAKTVYHFEKHGSDWLINSETVIEETSTLKYGEARYVDFQLNTPKQIGSDKFYTVQLKTDLPPQTIAVASIGNEKIIYPQTKSEDAFRRLAGNTLERVFKSNSDSVNEYAVASIGLTHTENYDEEHIKVYMSGLGFIMTRINVVPQNKYINLEVKNEQNK